MNDHQAPDSSISLLPALAGEYETFRKLRGWPKHLWMMAHKTEVAAFYRDHGLIAATHRYRMSPRTLASYVSEVEHDEHYDDAPPVRGRPGVFIKGGAKHQWLVAHKEEVRAYFKEHGFYKTTAHYRLYQTTMLALLDADPDLQSPELRLAEGALRRYKNLQPVLEAIKEASDKADRAALMAESSSAGVAQLRREIHMLREEFEAFQQTVSQQVGQAIVGSLMKNMKLPKKLAAGKDTRSVSVQGW
jgi:hypothetical protein